ncbi:MAG: hypothetical protein ACJ74M_05725 [Gaiellaceae bacterium]|jgi:hypothetical protein
MRQFLTVSLAAVLALLVVTTASGAGTQFAAGSAKTDVEVVADLQHMSFSAHSLPTGPPGFPPSPCAASGSIVYDTPTLHLKVDVQGLVIDPGSATASIIGAVTSSSDPTFQNEQVKFDVLDGDQLSSATDVTPDGFQFDGFPPSPCAPPLAVSGPVTSGNIVIKATGSLAIP